MGFDYVIHGLGPFLLILKFEGKKKHIQNQQDSINYFSRGIRNIGSSCIAVDDTCIPTYQYVKSM